MTKPVAPPRYEWCVRYRRRNWEWLQVRFYQSLPATWRLVARLERRPKGGLKPLDALYVQRRVVGQWEDVDLDDLDDLIDAYHKARARR